jgi:hypothetical protein
MTVGVAVSLVAAAGVWAFGPLREPPPLTPAGPAQPPPGARPLPETTARVALNRAAFQSPIWVAPTPPPPPPSPEAAPPPPPPLKLQLLAIIAEDDVGQPHYRAMVYDPDTDRVLVVSAGEKLGTRTVDSIDQLAVRIKDERGTRVLTLKSQGTTP